MCTLFSSWRKWLKNVQHNFHWWSLKEGIFKVHKMEKSNKSSRNVEDFSQSIHFLSISLLIIDYWYSTVKDRKQFEGGPGNSAEKDVHTLAWWKHTAEHLKHWFHSWNNSDTCEGNLHVQSLTASKSQRCESLHTGLHQIHLHLTVFMAVELSLSEHLLQWRNVNLSVSTLQQWPVFFFFFFCERRQQRNKVRHKFAATNFCGKPPTCEQTAYYTVWFCPM